MVKNKYFSKIFWKIKILFFISNFNKFYDSAIFIFIVFILKQRAFFSGHTVYRLFIQALYSKRCRVTLCLHPTHTHTFNTVLGFNINFTGRTYKNAFIMTFIPFCDLLADTLSLDHATFFLEKASVMPSSHWAITCDYMRLHAITWEKCLQTTDQHGKIIPSNPV